jgi:hypothetical protein
MPDLSRFTQMHKGLRLDWDFVHRTRAQLPRVDLRLRPRYDDSAFRRINLARPFPGERNNRLGLDFAKSQLGRIIRDRGLNLGRLGGVRVTATTGFSRQNLVGLRLEFQ